MVQNMSMQDGKGGIEAFLEKRDPNWTHTVWVNINYLIFSWCNNSENCFESIKKYLNSNHGSIIFDFFFWNKIIVFNKFCGIQLCKKLLLIDSM